jgi:hypothetical protein
MQSASVSKPMDPSLAQMTTKQSYFLARSGISDVSTASNSNFGSSASGAK